jgi:hypothetical protein
MKKLFLIVSLAAIAAGSVSRLLASDPFGSGTPTPATASINIYDWYNLGEHIAVANEFNYNLSVSQHLEDAYKGIYELMLKVHVGDATIAAFKQYYQSVKALPWDKDWSAWTKGEQEAWKNGDLFSAWHKALNAEAAKATPSVLFYWLGWHSMKVAWSVPQYVNNKWIDDATTLLAYAAQDCNSFATESQYSEAFNALPPDLQKAVSVIGAANSKLNSSKKPQVEDPFGNGKPSGADPAPRLTDEEIAKMVAAAKQIRAAAQGHSLLKEN